MDNQKPKLFSKAPLPFVGQKRNFLKAFRSVITDNIINEGCGWTIIDVFGGSGLLANNAKHLLPNARVIYNDFDNYSNRLSNLADTNRLLILLTDVLSNSPRGKKISDRVKAKVKDTVNNFDGFIDLQTLSTWLLFSGKQVGTLDELWQHTMYNTIRRTQYEIADNYLDGIELTSVPFEILMSQYKTSDKTLFILDPPYVSTKQGAYALDEYFGMVQFLRLMSLTRPPYIMFSSTRSELLSYIDHIKEYDVME
ncbi:DNA adenine methylase [Psychrobacter lutiphocae]|uniref:DNA adenine methylase n=1 Tax=Psychrobacter lutiphocae TaxID=540500 RepID=UPI000362EF3B|nr:DNA adenine methylase [Psychrobacter lutiphocae]